MTIVIETELFLVIAVARRRGSGRGSALGCKAVGIFCCGARSGGYTQGGGCTLLGGCSLNGGCS